MLQALAETVPGGSAPSLPVLELYFHEAFQSGLALLEYSYM